MEEIHPGTPVTLLVENKSRRFNYRGVFIVKKLGKNYLVKLKRGDATPLSSAGLRQEMLLDYLFFQLDGILYYDLEKDKFQELSFKFEGRGSSSEQRLLRGYNSPDWNRGGSLILFFMNWWGRHLMITVGLVPNRENRVRTWWLTRLKIFRAAPDKT